MSHQIMVLIFTHQSPGNTFRNCSVILSHGRDVNKEAGIRVNPSGVNDVELVFNPADSVVWVDLEQVASSGFNLWQTEMVLRHVIVFGQIGDGCL